MNQETEQEQQRQLQLANRQRERFLNKSRQLVSKYLYKLETLPGMPDHFRYFHTILKEVFLENNVIGDEMTEVFVGTHCVMMPQELIYAAGAQPIKLCSGNYIGYQFGDDLAPRDACPLVKAIIGNNHIGSIAIHDACSMYIVPVTCDCKKKMASVLSQYKETYAPHVPLHKTDDDAMDSYVRELKQLTAAIEVKTGIKATGPRIREAIGQMAEVQRQVRRFIDLKGNDQLLIRGSHAMAVLNSAAYDDMVRWGEQLRLLNDELELRLHQKQFLTRKKLPRILLTGSPITFPNLKIPLLIEEMGGVVAADETCMGDRGMYDPVSVCEDSVNGYYRALANRYVAPCSCPVFPDNRQRLERLKQMAENHHVEGVIYHVLRGCLVYDYEYQKIEEIFSAAGIPCIRVESDYNEEDIEQLRIRIEAFIEMIKFSEKSR